MFGFGKKYRYLVETGDFVEENWDNTFLHSAKRNIGDDVRSCLINSPEIVDSFGQIEDWEKLTQELGKLGYTLESVNYQDNIRVGCKLHHGKSCDGCYISNDGINCKLYQEFEKVEDDASFIARHASMSDDDEDTNFEWYKKRNPNRFGDLDL